MKLSISFSERLSALVPEGAHVVIKRKPPPADDIVEITRQRLADGRRIADHDVARLVEMIDAYREVLRMVLEQISQRVMP